jgi:hypothetical protein
MDWLPCRTVRINLTSIVAVWNDIMSTDPSAANRPTAYVLEWDRDPLAPALEVHATPMSGQVELCWQTATNRFYQLLHSSTLTNSWVPVSTNYILGNGMKRCETYGVLPGSPQKFYRI